jgi:predicted RNA methylase
MKYQNIREEELKNKVAQDYFWIYDCTKIIGNVDFCVCMHQSQKELFEQESLLWAEAKKGSSDIYNSIVQLILTIGKARTFDKFLPPAMLGAFDGEKIAFIPYNDIHEVFYINDFNWNVTPSNHTTKEFKLIHEKVKTVIDIKALLFNFLADDRELKKFIKKNFIVGKFGLTKTKIDKNNFMVIYNKWLQAVKPTIAVNWDIAKKTGIIDGDFYLADLLSQENNTLKEKLFVLLRHDHYELDRKLDEAGMFSSKRTDFTDKQVAHTQFWNKYDRPPKEEYWDYIVERRDLLVPQDVRERKGSYFTPQIWVELSQKYLTDVLGEDWQDEYYIWDCACGTGNLLTGLTNKYNIWASTLDSQDVEVIHDRIKNGANLLDDHVFQFDFLNDDFTKLPRPLQDIINNPEKRKKLVVYINPPYAEATSSKTISNTDSKHKKSVATSKTKEKYESILNQASKELFVQFLYRAYVEIEGCYIGNFSKVKILQGNHYKEFRENFHAKLEKLFIVPSYTFDNVTGKFPIGFFIWNTQVNCPFQNVNADVYEQDTTCIGHKNMFVPPNKNIKDWLRQYNTTSSESIAYLVRGSADVQNNNVVFVTLKPSDSVLKASNANKVSKDNLIVNAIFLTVRKVIEQTWVNDRDQYLYPNSNWENDEEFKSDCLAFILFDQSNTVKSNDGINHWIPFSEQEVNSREKFDSNFMTKFINGKLKNENKGDLFGSPSQRTTPLVFSTEAKAVFDAGRELWKYYHSQPNCNVNASLYDIREHFQGINEAGKMNNKSSDETYMNLIGDLREKLRQLADKIEPKVYEYEFLKQ